MRISDLSRLSGVSIPTIKFYLREGLLPPGHRTAPNQATYDETHVRRLHLIRVLVEIGDMSLHAVREVLHALGRRDAPLHETLAVAHTALRRGQAGTDPGLPAARAETDAWLNGLGWNLMADTPARDDLAGALLALRQLGWPAGPEVFERYAVHADALAEAEIAYVAASRDREAAVETTVIGTVVFERALVALRRLAEEHHSRTRFSATK
jgi:DNA-binding transcriptional MerR regulator